MNGENQTTRYLEAQIAKVNELIAQIDQLAQVAEGHEIRLPAEIDDLVSRIEELEKMEAVSFVQVLGALRG